MSTELHSLVGPYALDALDEREQAAFEQHLDSCRTCPGELVEFRATAARLADGVSSPPPARLRESVLTAVRHTAQQRPVVTVVPAWRWRRIVPMLLSAAVVLAVLAVGGLYVFDREADQATEIADVMTASDVVIRPRAGGPVHVYTSPSLGQAVVVVDGLPEIDDQHSYEVWAIDEDGPRSLGAMPESAESGRRLVGDLGDASAVAVTVEQAGGSPNGQPTTDPVKTVDLT